MKQFILPMLFIAFFINAHSQTTVTKTVIPYANPDSAGVYTIVQEQPEFRGGEKELTHFIQSHLHYPSVDSAKHIQGRVLIRFVVNEKGKVENVKVTQGVSPAIDAEAVRVVRLLPEFLPGKMMGKPVKVYFNLPITFKLPN